MELNEVMVNEDVFVEATEEFANAGTGNSVKAFVAGGIAVIVGGVIYKKVIKPLVAKVKAKKAEKRKAKEDEDFEKIMASITKDSEEQDEFTEE